MMDFILLGADKSTVSTGTDFVDEKKAIRFSIFGHAKILDKGLRISHSTLHYVVPVLWGNEENTMKEGAQF